MEPLNKLSQCQPNCGLTIVHWSGWKKYNGTILFSCVTLPIPIAQARFLETIEGRRQETCHSKHPLEHRLEFFDTRRSK